VAVGAKVLRNEKKITAYVAEIRDNFLTGRYITRGGHTIGRPTAVIPATIKP